MRFRLVLALLAFTALAIALLSAPAGFRPEPQSAEAALLDEVKKLLASDAEGGDRFGKSVAVSGGTAVVGADGEDAGGNQAGAAYVFQRDQGGPGNWGEVKKLTASGAGADDVFGTRVAVSGDTAVVGAALEDTGGSGAGAAYVFQQSASKDPNGDADGDTIPNSTDPDDDNDGCTDLQELGADETLGGRRNPHNPWDFYDTNADGIIDLFNDIFGVIQHFSLDGAPPYDVTYDRGPSAGPNAWNMTAPDGIIDVFTDILGVVTQFTLTGCA